MKIIKNILKDLFVIIVYLNWIILAIVPTIVGFLAYPIVIGARKGFELADNFADWLKRQNQ